MTWPVAIMYLVATLLGLLGAGLLLRLRTPLSQPKLYAFRMTGIMAIAAAITLGASATAMWRWTVVP